MAGGLQVVINPDVTFGISFFFTRSAEICKPTFSLYMSLKPTRKKIDPLSSLFLGTQYVCLYIPELDNITKVFKLHVWWLRLRRKRRKKLKGSIALVISFAILPLQLKIFCPFKL